MTLCPGFRRPLFFSQAHYRNTPQTRGDGRAQRACAGEEEPPHLSPLPMPLKQVGRLLRRTPKVSRYIGSCLKQKLSCIHPLVLMTQGIQ